MNKRIKITIFLFIFSLSNLCYAEQISKPSGWGNLSTELSDSISNIWSDEEYNLALSDTYNLYEWGRVGSENVTIPRRILKNAKKIVDSSGLGYGAITQSNELFLWGINYNNLVPSNNVFYPTKVKDGIKDALLASFLTRNEGGFSSTINLYTVNLKDELFVNKFSVEEGWKEIKVMDNIDRLYYGGYDKVIAISNDNELYIWSPLVYLKSIDSTLYNKSDLRTLSEQKDFVANGKCDAEVGPIKLLDNVKEVSCSTSGFMALTYEGDVYLWGDCGQLIGEKNVVSSPVKYISNVKSVWVDRRKSVYYYIDNNFDLWKIELLKWQNNKPILSQKNKVYSGVRKMISTGIDGERLLLQNGKILSKGMNNYGELGLGLVSDGVWDKYTYVKGFKERRYPSQSYISNSSNIGFAINGEKLDNVKLFTYNNKTYISIRDLIDNSIINVQITKSGDYEIVELNCKKKFIFDQYQLLLSNGKSYLQIRDFANQFGYNLSIQGNVLYLN